MRARSERRDSPRKAASGKTTQPERDVLSPSSNRHQLVFLRSGAHSEIAKWVVAIQESEKVLCTQTFPLPSASERLPQEALLRQTYCLQGSSPRRHRES